MKKSLFVMMLAAALMGSQVFAAVIPTALDGISYTSGAQFIGVKNDSGEASGGNVTVSYSETGSNHSQDEAFGGYGDTATNNKVTMTGGQVAQLFGGRGTTSASGNTVIMTGGSVRTVRCGSGNGKSGFASGNVAIVAGDCEITGSLFGGVDTYANTTANDNKVYLVGKGATATIADAQGNTATYTGGAISLKSVYVGMTGAFTTAAGTKEGNSIDIYGTGITATGEMACMQILNFHIADGVLLSQEAMVSLTSTSVGLDLTGVELGFNADAVEDWSAFDGKTITLVQAAQAITIDAGSLGEVAIKGADGATVATATLALGGSNDALTLTGIKGATPVPEPSTGALSLLALAGLCARRRK